MNLSIHERQTEASLVTLEALRDRKLDGAFGGIIVVGPPYGAHRGKLDSYIGGTYIRVSDTLLFTNNLPDHTNSQVASDFQADLSKAYRILAKDVNGGAT